MKKTAVKYKKTKYPGVYQRGATFSFKLKNAPRRDGTRGDLWKGGFQSAKAANDARVEERNRLITNTFVQPTRLSYADFLRNKWLPAIRSTIRPATLDSYENIVRAHVVPRLGTSRLQDLTADSLNVFYADLLQRGHRTGRPLSPKTVRNVHVVVRKSLADAAKWGWVTRNVAEFADPPKLRASGRAEMKAWTADELRHFLDRLRGDRLFACYLLAASTGMRRGEVLGARWQDFDLHGRLAIRQTLISVGYQVTFSTPKTRKGRRSITVDAATADAIRGHRKAQLEERLLFGSDYQDLDLMFCQPDGSPLHPQSVSQAFERHVKQAGLPLIRFHDLRHTFATLALQAGVNAKVVSDLLGHATVAFTLDVYSHAIPSMQAEATETVARLVRGES